MLIGIPPLAKGGEGGFETPGRTDRDVLMNIDEVLERIWGEL